MQHHVQNHWECKRKKDYNPLRRPNRKTIDAASFFKNRLKLWQVWELLLLFLVRCNKPWCYLSPCLNKPHFLGHFFFPFTQFSFPDNNPMQQKEKHGFSLRKKKRIFHRWGGQRKIERCFWLDEWKIFQWENLEVHMMWRRQMGEVK